MKFNVDPMRINPIFLLALGVVAGVGAYLITGPARGLIFLLAVFGFVGAIVLWRLQGAYAKTSSVVASGARGVATTIAFAPTGDTMGRSSRMRVDFEVAPNDGSPPFVFRETRFYRNDALPQIDERFEAYFTSPKQCVIGDYLRPSMVEAPAAAPAVSGVDEIARLAQLHAEGVLDDAEFAEAKRRLLERL